MKTGKRYEPPPVENRVVFQVGYSTFDTLAEADSYREFLRFHAWCEEHFSSRDNDTMTIAETMWEHWVMVPRKG